MSKIPQDPAFESTFQFTRDPYRFISKKCELYHSPIFETRLLLQKTICLMGADAARVFYNPRYFIRKGAAPGRVQKTLFGTGGIQGTDGEIHEHRKKMFMSFMTPDHINKLININAKWWQNYISAWSFSNRKPIKLYQAAQEILCRTVCEWASVPLGKDIKKRTSQLTALFDGAGAIGFKHWRSRFERWRANKWVANFINDIRTHKIKLPKECLANTIAWYCDPYDKLLDSNTAAVELINILRPTVAVSVYITFMAVALHTYPENIKKIKDDKEYAQFFIQEVRRFYPFFPSVAAIVKEDFVWRDYFFPKGQKVLLDLYGTNHDKKIWRDPHIFQPERFRGWHGCPFSFIPQGGGDYINHRCPGEWITIELMRIALKFLTEKISYEVPTQNLNINMSRLPAIPSSGFIIENIKIC